MTSKRRQIIKRESILGLPVIDGRTGEKIGVVKDLHVKDQNAYLQGFYVTGKGWGNKTIGIAFDDATVGYDAIIAEGEVYKSSLQEIKSGVIEKLLKKRVVREDGVELGVISDIILDPLTGRIEGLELSESVIGDLISGRQMLPYEPYESMEGDTLVVTMEQAENITSGNKGIKNIFFNKIE
ncbi:MAG: PRC-barrel domain-containing protein [Candidatus Cloacimonetes bacterium]|nr:PRC-barrel domain-containing protein [Candidatus Cloacimonadota bacterium]